MVHILYIIYLHSQILLKMVVFSVLDLYDCVINANRLENPEKRMLRIKKLLHELPDHNFETFRYLAEHLDKVACMGHMNKVSSRSNLGSDAAGFVTWKPCSF